MNSGESAFSLPHRFSSPLSTMSFHRAQLEQHLYSLCVLFSPSLSILSIVQFKSPIIILFSFLSFIFCICSPQKSAPSPAVLWCYTLKGHKQRTLSLEGVTLKDTNLPFGSVSTSVIPSRPRWSRKSIPFVWNLQERKRRSPISYFLNGVFDHGWYEFQLKWWWLFFGFSKTQVPDPA